MTCPMTSPTSPPLSRSNLRPRLIGALCVAGVLLLACPPKDTTRPDAATEAPPPGSVLLDGKVFTVAWSDGDTFKIKSGELSGTNARLSGFNTLEDYGPVHRWGEWTPKELYALAKAPESLLSARGWTCTSSGDRDKYKRLLVSCPDVAETLVGEGLAMVFVLDGAPPEALVKAQREAQEAKKGMWQKGAPPIVVTSIHSSDEGRGYNRLADTRTGKTTVRSHEERYETCQEVCEGPTEQPSCMTYVPYERRYKNVPECLR